MISGCGMEQKQHLHTVSGFFREMERESAGLMWLSTYSLHVSNKVHGEPKDVRGNLFKVVSEEKIPHTYSASYQRPYL